VPLAVEERKKGKQKDMRMIKRMITGNGTENRCCDVRTGGI
jgi:hypothetical protein